MRALSAAIPNGTIPQVARPAIVGTRACDVMMLRYARIPLLMPSGYTFPTGIFSTNEELDPECKIALAVRDVAPTSQANSPTKRTSTAPVIATYDLRICILP